VFPIYWVLSVQNFITIRSDLTFLLYDVYGITFSGQSVYKLQKNLHMISDEYDQAMMFYY